MCFKIAHSFPVRHTALITPERALGFGISHEAFGCHMRQEATLSYVRAATRSLTTLPLGTSTYLSNMYRTWPNRFLGKTSVGSLVEKLKSGWLQICNGFKIKFITDFGFIKDVNTRLKFEINACISEFLFLNESGKNHNNFVILKRQYKSTIILKNE